jgi:hypothetical protein
MRTAPVLTRPWMRHWLFLHRIPAHHGSVGTEGRRYRLAFALCLLIPLSGTAGCAYDYPEPAHTSAADPVPAAPSPRPYSNLQVLEQEARNYAELDRILKASPEPILLIDEGPLDGPFRGFGKAANVPAAGLYTVTAACVGASRAKVAVGQEHAGAPFQPTEIALDCIGATSQPIALQQGFVFAHLVLPSPGDTPWTGAVGGVRVGGTG